MNIKIAILLLATIAMGNARSYLNRGYHHMEEDMDSSPEITPTPVVILKSPSDDFNFHLSGRSHLTKSKSDEFDDEKARHAKYSFVSAQDDGIMDQSQVRQESRDGLKVTGSYSYSDGYFKRTVNYEADENGYRVVSSDSEPIGSGPQVDLINGKADVHTQIEGVDTQYSVSAGEIQKQGITRDSKSKLEYS